MRKEAIKELTKNLENIKTDVMPTPAEKKKILKQRAELLKKQVKREKIVGEQLKGLEFTLANEQYIIDATYVTKVITLKELTVLPCTPQFILGITNVGGKIIAVISLKNFLNLQEKERSSLNKVIVVKYEDIELGIIVDEIKGSTHLFLDKLQKNVSAFNGSEKDFLMGITKNRVIVFNIKKFLTSDLITINDVL